MKNDERADAGALRKELRGMSLAELLDEWEAPMPRETRELLLGELRDRGYRTRSLSTPPSESDPSTTDAGAVPPGLDPEVLRGERSESRLRWARLSLVVVTVVQVLFGIAQLGAVRAGDGAPTEEEMVRLYTPFGVAGLFLLLWFWARSKPRYALPTGLALFVGLHLLTMIADPSQVLRGLFMKVLVTGALIYGTVEAWRAREDEDAAEEDAFLA